MFEIRRNHTIYPGSFKKRSIGLMKRKTPVELVEKEVHGMFPHSKLGDKMRNTFMLMKEVNILIQLKSQWSLNKEIKKAKKENKQNL